MTATRVREIVGALRMIPALHEPGPRALYRREVENEVGRKLSTSHDAGNAQLDLVHLIRGCEQESGGLEALLTVVSTLNESSRAAAELSKLLQEWFHERQLIPLLEDVPFAQLAAAVLRVTGRPVTQVTVGPMVQSIGWQTAERWGVPALLAVIDTLLAETPAPMGVAEWLNGAAGHVGLGKLELEQLRDVTARYRQQLQAQGTVTETGGPDDPEQSVKRIVIEEAPVLGPPIRGGIPPRNRFFTGREAVMEDLHDTLEERHRASVLPETALQGYGGVGKTQIAIEYAYRNADSYQLIWWMHADEPAAVRAQLSVLAARLGLPSMGSLEQTVRSVLDVLASATSMNWLLIYDNADDPADLDGLVPPAGGHVVITSRNPAWAVSGTTLEVDVFTRVESTEMLRKHRPDMSESEADRLAEVLGDLPLALEQAVTWLITTVTSVDDYLEEFSRRKRSLLSEGRPRNYPYTVLTFVALAVERMRQEAPVAAQLLETMAFLGTEPLTTTLLWEGRRAELTEPLHTALQERNEIARAVRDLVRLGLAKADHASRRITVHRLVQAVLREELSGPLREDSRRNARRLLAAANPGYPDDQATWARHAEIRPHVRAADLVHGELAERSTVMDQVRYVYNTGDFESCAEWCAEILQVWDKPMDDGGYGREDPLTLLALRRYSDALRVSGHPDAAGYAKQALDGLVPTLGESHESTMGAVMGVGADLRIAGRMTEARELDRKNLERHIEVLGPGDPSTLRAMNSVAINLRWAGDFRGAYEIDVEAERQARSALGELDSWTFFAIESQARDLLLLGRYQEALDLQLSVLPKQIALLGESHISVLRAQTLVAAMLRKTGRISESLMVGQDTYRSLSVRFGPQHAVTLYATQTLANTMRAAGDPARALSLITDVRDGYRNVYGEEHPLSLCTAVNEAAIHRALNNDRDALAIDEATRPVMAEALGEDHPYMLSLRTNLGTDFSRAHRLAEALEVSSAVWQTSARLRGTLHPYTLHAACNTALDMINAGQVDQGEKLYGETLVRLEQVYGPNNPETEAARRYRRIECELEPGFV